MWLTLKLVAAIAVIVIAVQTVSVSGKITNPIPPPPHTYCSVTTDGQDWRVDSWITPSSASMWLGIEIAILDKHKRTDCGRGGGGDKLPA